MSSRPLDILYNFEQCYQNSEERDFKRLRVFQCILLDRGINSRHHYYLEMCENLYIVIQLHNYIK